MNPIREAFLSLGEYVAAALYEEPDRGLFYRKALALRRYYEQCEPAEYHGELLYPSGAVRHRTQLVPYYLHGLLLRTPSLKEVSPWKEMHRDFYAFRSTVPAEHSVAGNMYTHSFPHYERILRQGLLSYLPRIERIADRDTREGLIHLVEGIRTYLDRCVAYLRSVSASEDLIRALERVPLYPAETAYEAIVAWNFILYLDNCDNLGCLAKGLRPYFHGEDLVPLLENLYDNLDKNNGYSMSLDSQCPALTVQCLTAARGRRRPMIELLVDGDTPEEVWQAALETVRTGGGQPAFYNARVLLEGLKRRFPSIRDEDIGQFCGGGCTEAMLAGLSNVGSLDAGINLLLILERFLYDRLPSAKSFEELYEGYLAEVRATVEHVKREINRSRQNRAEFCPLPMRTLLVDDCIDRGIDYNAGGARYGWSIINFAGMVNVIDSLLAVKTLVFDEGRYTPHALLSRLRENDSALLSEAIRLPCGFGKDGDETNRFAGEISQRIFSMTEGGELCFGEGFLSASIQFMSQVAAGKHIGATPDGREAGAPLADSLAAILGKDSSGPTALLSSVTSLDLSGALGVPVVNLNITRDLSDGVLKALITAYLERGGIQLQITHASRQELLDAYEHPERHGNLIVRVGGYSEYFCRLSDELKRMVIGRSIQTGDSL